MTTETFEFQVEARQLLQRYGFTPSTRTRMSSCAKLVSNASDALDKLRLAALRTTPPTST